MGQHHQRLVVVALFERQRKIAIFKAVSCTSRSMFGEVMVEQGGIGFTRGLLR